MYKRRYSLKTRYNFDKVLRRGETFHSPHLVVKFLRVNPKVFETDKVDKKFGIIASSKFSKRATVQNHARRIIAESIQRNIDKFAPYYYYVFIPKKGFLNGSGKVKSSLKTIDTEINIFLSKVDFS